MNQSLGGQRLWRPVIRIPWKHYRQGLKILGAGIWFHGQMTQPMVIPSFWEGLSLARYLEVTWQGSTGWWEYAGLLLPWQPGSHLSLKQILLPVEVIWGAWETNEVNDIQGQLRWSGPTKMIKEKNLKYLLQSLSPQEVQLWLPLNQSFVMQAGKQHFWEGQQQFWQDLKPSILLPFHFKVSIGDNTCLHQMSNWRWFEVLLATQVAAWTIFQTSLRLYFCTPLIQPVSLLPSPWTYCCLQYKPWFDGFHHSRPVLDSVLLNRPAELYSTQPMGLPLGNIGNRFCVSVRLSHPLMKLNCPGWCHITGVNKKPSK